MFVPQEQGNQSIASQSESKIINQTITTLYMNILKFKTHIELKFLNTFSQTREKELTIMGC